jgi:hypothetical protein
VTLNSLYPNLSAYQGAKWPAQSIRAMIFWMLFSQLRRLFYRTRNADDECGKFKHFWIGRFLDVAVLGR